MHSESGNADLYKEAGVDVAAGDQLVDWLQEQGPSTTKTRFGATVAGIGGFAALFRPNFTGMVDPLLITSTDGVGTKVLLGLQTGHLEGLGQDLVAMCVNDLYTVGGRPLLFLDYYATGVLDQAQFKAVLTGIRAGCTQSGAALIGGETAELPGLYAKGHFDLAGFVVGVVDGALALGPTRVQVGDELYALPASGFHSNGYSLVRHWLKDRAADAATLTRLMAPTRIYHEIPDLLERVGPDALHALANITGGGISGNLPRVLPQDTRAVIDFAAVPTPPWMSAFLAANGTTARAQEAVFNLGAGMIAVVAAGRAAEVVAAARELGLPLTRIGKIAAGSGEATVDFV